MIPRRTFLKAFPVLMMPCIIRAAPGLGFFGKGKSSAPSLLAITALGSFGGNNSGNSGVGFRFTPTVNLTITDLARWKVSGQTQTQSHTVSIRTNPYNTVLASVSVNLATSTAGQFNYVTLGSPLAVNAGTDYFCLSDESGGEWSYDAFPCTYNSGDLGACISAFVSGGSSYGTNAGNTVYVPVNFKYHK